MIRVYWQRPIVKMVEGAYPDGIVAYARRPWLVERWHAEDERVLQYEYLLRIDLWIVKLSLRWLGRKTLERGDG